MRSLLLLSALFSLPAFAEISLLETLRRDQSLIDRITGSVETINHVKLLHLGRSSMPERLKLIKSSRRHLFLSVPYWYSDVSGKATYAALAQKLEAKPDLDVRILTDWTSPGSTGDIFGIGMVLKLFHLTDGNLMLWNPPWWGRRFSKKITENRLHDKMMIVDGEKLLMGGLNIGDTYLQGGITRKGWHDTDVLIEGPAAGEAGKIFVKVWELSRYLKSHRYFPSFRREGWQFLEDYFYRGKERLQYVKRILGFSYEVEVKIPNRNQIRSLGLDRAKNQPVMGGVPVRLLYDNPLLNHGPNRGARAFCDFHCLLERFFSASQRSVRIFAPYLTISQKFRSLLVQTARRGIKVEIITNSLKSHDIGAPAYYASMSHYIPLLEAGVMIHEWQGHAALLALEEKHDCTIPDGHWPGRTLHTKALILDGEVGILGSHNMNVRSEHYNTEVMAIVADSGFAQELNTVFEHDLDRRGPRTVPCGKKNFPRKARVRTITLPEARRAVSEYKGKINFYRQFQSVI